MITQEQFLHRSREAHGYIYDYSAAEYTGATAKVEIICPEWFEMDQSVYEELSGWRGE